MLYTSTDLLKRFEQPEWLYSPSVQQEEFEMNMPHCRCLQMDCYSLLKICRSKYSLYTMYSFVQAINQISPLVNLIEILEQMNQTKKFKISLQLILILCFDSSSFNDSNESFAYIWNLEIDSIITNLRCPWVFRIILKIVIFYPQKYFHFMSDINILHSTLFPVLHLLQQDQGIINSEVYHPSFCLDGIIQCYKFVSISRQKLK